MLARSRFNSFSALFLAFFLSLTALHTLHAASGWTTLAPGMDYKYIQAKTPSAVGDSRIFILRMDPALWQLEMIGVSQTGDSKSHTAREWSRTHNFFAAINAGM